MRLPPFSSLLQPQSSPTLPSSSSPTALQLYVSSWENARHDTLRLALERLCTDAHYAKLGPERVVVAVKAAWARVPCMEGVDVERARVIRNRVVGYCIEAYFRETS